MVSPRLLAQPQGLPTYEAAGVEAAHASFKRRKSSQYCCLLAVLKLAALIGWREVGLLWIAHRVVDRQVSIAQAVHNVCGDGVTGQSQALCAKG